MKDFDSNELEVGDIIFFTLKHNQSTIGKITSFSDKNNITINIVDLIKISPKMMEYHNIITKANGGEILFNYTISCDNVIKIGKRQNKLKT